MSFTYPDYLKLKNRYCLGYFGVFDEFILQLLYIQPIVEQSFPGLKLYIACRDGLDLPGTTPISNLNKYNYGYFRELSFDNINHPVLSIIKETKIQLPSLKPLNKNNKNKICVIATKGLGVVRSLTDTQVEKVKKMAEDKGFGVLIDCPLENAEWVIGVESFNFYKTALNGAKRISLIPTGLSPDFFQIACPFGEILDI